MKKSRFFMALLMSVMLVVGVGCAKNSVKPDVKPDTPVVQQDKSELKAVEVRKGIDVFKDSSGTVRNVRYYNIYDMKADAVISIRSMPYKGKMLYAVVGGVGFNPGAQPAGIADSLDRTANAAAIQVYIYKDNAWPGETRTVYGVGAVFDSKTGLVDMELSDNKLVVGYANGAVLQFKPMGDKLWRSALDYVFKE